MKKILIITDLDGTLLHPETCSFEEAKPALAEIRRRGIPLVLCSSKTRPEIEVWRDRLSNGDPFISENGGGIFVPEGRFPFPVGGEQKGKYRVITLGRPYDEIRKIFSDVREESGIRARGFGDMPAEEIAALAGLPLPEAVLAKEREFDEPFIFDEGETRKDIFFTAMEALGLRWTQGRFYHALGSSDKGRAVRIIRDLYERMFGKIETIGLGDSFNDLPLLRETDYPVLVQKEGSDYEQRINLPNLIKADGIGPVGWNRAVTELIGQ